MLKILSMRRGILCLLTLFFTSVLSISAQSIRGRVVDELKKPLKAVDIYLLKSGDSSLVSNAATDSMGRYRFEKVLPGSYFLEFEYSGYQGIWVAVVVDTANVRKDIVLDRLADVGQVVVTAKKDPVVQKNDTVEFNASNYKVNKDASAENLVTKMPGITSENGTIKANGEEVKKVTVDGQDFFGDDAAAALKNLPAEVIDRIQVYDRQSDQSRFSGFDDGNSQKTLNIVTKAGKNNGQFGKVYGGYGTNDRWTGGGNINVFKGKQRLSFIGLSNNINQQNFTSQDILGALGTSGGSGGPGGGGRGGSGGPRGGGGQASNFMVGQQNGINTTNSFGFNYSGVAGKKLQLTASYFYNNSINRTASFLNRTYFLSSQSNQLYQQGDTGTTKNYNHRANVRLEYTFDSLNSLIWTPSVRFQNTNSNSRFLGATSSEELIRLNRSLSETNSSSNGYNISNNLLLRHKFRKGGRTLSLNLNHSINKSTGNSLLVSGNSYYVPAAFTDAFRQNTDNNSNSQSFSPTLSLTQNIGKRSSFELNYNPSWTWSKSYRYTTRYDSTTGEFTHVDSLLSNTFDNMTSTQKAGLTYRYKYEKLSFNLGANAQTTLLESEQTFPQQRSVSKPFNNILPNAMLTYQFTKSKNLRVYYRSSTNLPSISQLQNVVNNSNPLILSSGNPELKQEFSNNTFIRYNSTDVKKGRTFFLFGNMSFTKDYIGNRNILAANDTILDNGVELRKGAQINMPTNLKGYRSFRTFATYAFPVKKIKSMLNLNLGESVTRSPAIINGRTNYSVTYNSNAGAVLASNISEKIDYTLNYSANYSVVNNSIQSSLNNSYIIQNTNVKLNWMPKDYLVLNTEVTNSAYRGLGAAFNQSIWLWNAGLGYKFMKDKRAELRLSVFDLLKQNRSIVRTVTENYIEDKSTQILTRFYMLTFTYSVRNFRGKPSKPAESK